MRAVVRADSAKAGVGEGVHSVTHPGATARQRLIAVATIVTALPLMACVPQYGSPQQVQSTNPSVTYRYATDQDLLQVNQTAVGFCDRYRAVPRASRFTTAGDGSKIVEFDCVQTTMAGAQSPQFSPDMAYSYRSDQELLEASRSAQIHCMNSGAPQVLSSTTTNPDGTRTATFRCSRG